MKLSELSPSGKSNTSTVSHYDDEEYNESGMDTPFDLDVPSYLMCRPYTISIDNPNNVWMKKDEPIDYDLCMAQWQTLFNFFAGQADVWQLPPSGTYQDQVYVANLLLVLPHMDNMALLANMQSPPRRGEEWVGGAWLKMMKYDIKRPPYTWEGEAETKWLHDNVYAAGYGLRTDPRAYDWMEKSLDMKIIRVKMTDDKNYHFDCMFFPLTSEKALCATGNMTPEEIKSIEKEIDIISIPKSMIHNGLTNCVRVGQTVCYASALGSLSVQDPHYDKQKKNADFLMNTCAKEGLGVSLFNMSEMEKSGAALSCTIAHLNERSYEKGDVL